MNKLTSLSSKNVFILLSVLMKIGPSLTFASYGVFLARTLGLDPIAVNAVNQAFYIGMVFLEIPTGAIADKYGKRISYLLYCGLFAIGCALYFLSHNFFMAAMSEFILALASTFQSGSFSSWAEEKMKQEKESSESRKQARINADLYSRVASMVCAPLGSYLFIINPHLMWLACCCFMIITGIVAYFIMKESTSFITSTVQKEHANNLLEIMKIGFMNIKQDRNLRILFLQSSVFIFAIQAFNMQWQQALAVKEKDMGIIYLCMQFGILVGIILAKRISNPTPSKLFFVNSVTGLFLMITGLLGNFHFVAILFFVLHEIPRGVLGPINSHVSHGKISDNAPRATILSFESMANFFGGLLGLSFSGILAKYLGYQITWIVSGFILFAFSLVILYFEKKKKE